MRGTTLAVAALLWCLVPPPAPGAPSGFELLGHDPLTSRGMNAAPALLGGFAYVGNRTDGSPGHSHPGVLVVDVSNPRQMRVVGEIGPPQEGTPGLTSRELRVWPEQRLLIVASFACDAAAHACASAGRAPPRVRFYSLENPAAPALLATWLPPLTPHEMYLWLDPARAGRALLFVSSPNPAGAPNLLVADVSRARDGTVTELARWTPGAIPPAPGARRPVELHSMSVSDDGRRAYLAYTAGGFLILDASEVAGARPSPRLRLVTPASARAAWTNAAAHSAVAVPGRPFVLVTDESYAPCPWAWVRIIDVRDEARPGVAGEFRVEENTASFCPSAGRGVFSAHNPTIVGDLAFVTWHAGGLEAISLADPAHPRSLGRYRPAAGPARVTTEDPLLGAGSPAFWSYPIVSRGLIYVVDVRNGLYVLRYTGPGAETVASAGFVEGNSNVGRAPAPPASPPAATPPRTRRGWSGPAIAAVIGLAVLLAAVAVRTRRER
jgi:hypothetical protein